MSMILERDGYYDLPPGKLAAVVTYLEMTAPPPNRPGPRRSDLELRRIAADEPEVYRDLFRRVGSPWLWFSRLQLGDDALAAVIGDPAVEAYAVYRGDTSIGLLELDRRKPPDIELAFFGLVPEAVGGGAGRWLMTRAIDLAWAHRPRRFWVHTCTLDHPEALGFYLRSGFRATRRAVEVFDDLRRTGVLPADSAAGVPIL